MISVIIPTYNRAEMVTEAVKSALGQTCKDIEIIVVDDGSTDDTEQRLSRYSTQIRYVKQRNAGVNAARNHGIGIASGDFIALLDNDDLWLDFKLDAQLHILQLFPNIGFIFSDFIIQKDTGQNTHSGLSTWHTHRKNWLLALSHREVIRLPGKGGSDATQEREIAIRYGDIYHDSLHAPYVLPSTALIRRQFMDQDIRLNESDPSCGDWEYFARLSKRHSALYMDIETTINRSHEDAVRLTRLPQIIQVRRRISMIDRAWVADSAFYADHRTEVDKVRHGLWLHLTKLYLLDGDKNNAGLSLQRTITFNMQGMRWKEAALEWILLTPFSILLIRALRRARLFMRMLLG